MVTSGNRQLLYNKTRLDLKMLLLIFLITLSSSSRAEWVEYSTRANGDVHLFDNSRVQKNGNLLKVWNRIRYKTSVMGAGSYQSLMKIDCSERIETTVQNTFYTDTNWISPAMATDAKEKPKIYINANSATKRLTDILCD